VDRLRRPLSVTVGQTRRECEGYDNSLGKAFKAPFFHALGYSSENWRRLEVDLRTQHLTRDVTLEDQTPYGQKYSIRATLVGAIGELGGRGERLDRAYW
jgi:hypothetical protein